MRIADQEKGDCLALTAEYKGAPAGYINVYWNPPAGAFANRNIPEIVDFGVLEKYRCRGIGRRLMDIAEKLAKTRSDTVCLGVGLHSGYGSAQRMYVKEVMFLTAPACGIRIKSVCLTVIAAIMMIWFFIFLKH